MKRKIIGALLCTVLGTNLIAINSSAVSEIDPLNIKWQSSIAGNGQDYFNDVVKTNDGGFISVGDFKSTNINGLTNKGLQDAIIVKHDKDGVQEWVKSFGGNNNETFKKIIKLKDNSFIVVGETNSTDISGITNKGEEDVLIVKYDASGNVLWSKNWGGNSSDTLINITSTSEGGFIIVGGTNSTDIPNIISKGSTDTFITKFSSDGNEEWTKSFGGNKVDMLFDVINTSDNGYVAVGISSSTDLTNVTNNGMVNSVIVKYDNSGNHEWIKSFGGNKMDYFTSVVELENGSYAVGGFVSSTNIDGFTVPTNSMLGVISTYDNLGNYKSSKTFDNKMICGFEKSPSNEIFGLIENHSANTEFQIIKYDKSFNEVYVQNINSFMPYGFSFLSDDSIIVGGIGLNSNATVVKYVYPVKTLNKSDTLDLQVIADNSLEMSLSTNQISFKGYNGVADLTNNDLNITVTSGLYYDLYATLNDELRGSNDTQATINKTNLGIKTLEDVDYKNFVNIGEPLKLVENHVNGRNMNHNINLKLKGDSSVKADTYSTTITFETIQK